MEEVIIMHSNFFLTMKAVIKREWVLLKRYRVRLLADLIQPFLWVALFVFFGKAFLSGQGDTKTFTNYIILGVVLLMLISSALWGSGLMLRREQLYGTLEAIFISPANRFAMILGYSLFEFVQLLWFIGIAVAFGYFAFGFSVTIADPLAAVLILILTVISLYGFAILFSGITLLVKESNALINMLQPIIYIFCGIFFPVFALPPMLQTISWLIPITYGVMGIELVFVFGATFEELIVYYAALIISTIAYTILAVMLYKHIENLARSKGVAQTF
ncbi:MAG: ABC transporter permease [Candidatus Asgardarchaeia archaeon]|nr:MAG: hypothetical protein DRO67_04230 [Candidatus Asgardarchaeum californiense]